MDQEKRTDRSTPRLEVTEPCPKKWEELEGGEQKRYCGACRLHVFNSAAMTREEVREVSAQAEGRLCMRVVKDPSGQTKFADPKPARVAGLALAAGSSVLAACGSAPPEAPGVPVEEAPRTEPDAHPTDQAEDELGEVLMGAVPLELMGYVECVEPEPDSHLTEEELLTTLGLVYVESVPDPSEGEPDGPEILGRTSIDPEGH